MQAEKAEFSPPAAGSPPPGGWTGTSAQCV